MRVCLRVILNGRLLSCLRANLVDTVVDGVVGHSYLATRWRPDLPLGGATRVLKVLFLSCLWANLVDTWVGGWGGS